MQRIFALFVMITAILQITNAVGSTTWRDQVTAILQTRHKYFSDDIADAASAITIIWWLIILLGSSLLFMDKDLETFFEKAFRK
jgi:hypothetical protein